jgi:Zn ribbon nucleic-acid-binding protein
MYSDNGVHKISESETHQPNNKNTDQRQFVRSICPKCGIHHHIQMMWTGRGLPRKFCVQCRSAVAGYDEMTIYEPSFMVPGKSRTKAKLPACE